MSRGCVFRGAARFVLVVLAPLCMTAGMLMSIRSIVRAVDSGPDRVVDASRPGGAASTVSLRKVVPYDVPTPWRAAQSSAQRTGCLSRDPSSMSHARASDAEWGLTAVHEGVSQVGGGSLFLTEGLGNTCTITFEDANLEQAVRDAIGKPFGPLCSDDFIGLTYLNASRLGITDLGGLEWCTDLEYLDLFDNRIEDLTPLSGLTNVTTLDLGLNLLTDIGPLENLTNLAALELGNGNFVEIVYPPENTNRVTDIDPLEELTQLTYLGLAQNGIADIEALAYLPMLQFLCLQDNPDVSDFSPLSGLTELRYLAVMNTGMSNDALQVLGGMASLEGLGLANNNLTDLSALATLASYGRLWGLLLDRNPSLSDLEPLESLTSLIFLSFAGCAVQDLTPLSDLESLVLADFHDNRVVDLEPLRHLQDLNSIDLKGNLVGTIEPLSDPDINGAGIVAWGNTLSLESLCTDIPDILAHENGIDYDGYCGNTHALTIAQSGTGLLYPPVGRRIMQEGRSLNVSTLSNDSRWGFDHWEGCNTETLEFLPIVMDADRSLTGVFSPADWRLDMLYTTGGVVWPDFGSHGYLDGHIANIAAAPEPGWAFEHWEDCRGNIYSTDLWITFVMDHNLTTKAVFTQLPLPTATLIADPDTIFSGDSSTLSWTTTNANTCTLEPGFGPVAPEGSVVVTPAETNTYTLTAEGLYGAAQASALVTVRHVPEVSLTADPDIIFAGESSTLSWTSSYANTCTIDQGIGPVDPNGSVEVSPGLTTTYTITALGPGGSASDTSTLTVQHHPPVADFGGIPTAGAAPLDVAFTDTSDPGNGTITAWAWDFDNDGVTDSVAQNPIHRYATGGTYSVALEVTTEWGTAERVRSAFVSVTGQPVASFTTSPTSGVCPLTASFSDTSSSGGSAITGWAWDFDNDGQVDSTQQNPSHQYPSPGVYSVRLTVTTANGAQARLKRDYVRVRPSQVAPQSSGSFGETYQDRIAEDTAKASYDEKRFAIVTGEVEDVSHAPIAGVAVAVMNHPEYGTASTDAAGSFALPVEGGGTMSFSYTKQGFITAHRQMNVPWNDFAITEKVVLLTPDPVSTQVVLDGNPDTVVTHRATEVNDNEHPPRACTLVFTGDNVAYELSPDGTDVQPLTQFTARATEFTTKESMPAVLPPNSAYTYCADLHVDGVENVRFKKPIVMWVEDFLDVPVGEIVPVGRYDRDKGIWIPEKNGVVVKLLDANDDGIGDGIDANGDDTPDDLNGNLRTDDEVQGLTPGQLALPQGVVKTFWRCEVNHFSPWDCNWPYGDPTGSGPPGGGDPSGGTGGDGGGDPYGGGSSPTGCYVTHRGRVFHEDVPIPGSGLTLHYASDRTEDYLVLLNVPITDDTPPPDLKYVTATVKVAGQVFEQRVDSPVAPNQTVTFPWDGRDVFGNPVSAATAEFTVGYMYDAVLWTGGGQTPDAFALPGIRPLAVPARQEAGYSRVERRVIYGRPGHLAQIAEGWTLSNNHQMAPHVGSILYRGDGTTEEGAPVVHTIAGTGTSGHVPGPCPALSAPMFSGAGIACDLEGNVYLAEMYYIQMISRDGTLTTIAGNNSLSRPVEGPAASSPAGYPMALTVDSAGNLYIASHAGGCVARIEKDSGNLSIIAGPKSGPPTGYSGDGGPAAEARFNEIKDIGFDANGNLYIADSSNYRIRKIDTKGIVNTIAGIGISGSSGDGDLAIYAKLVPFEMAVAPDGTIYVGDEGNTLRRINTSGVIERFAGTGHSPVPGHPDVPGKPALETDFNTITALAIDSDGSLLLFEKDLYYGGRVLRVTNSGTIERVAGDIAITTYADDTAVADASFGLTDSLCTGPTGCTYVWDRGNLRVRCVGFVGVVATSQSENVFPDGNVHYIMDVYGRHLQTQDAVTQKVLEQFQYDTQGRLLSVADLFGDAITIDRDSNGVPTGIVNPYGVAMDLSVQDNKLIGVTYPDGGHFDFEYGTGGLLTLETVNGHEYGHSFDATGHVLSTLDPLDKQWSFSPMATVSGSTQYAATSPENLTTTTAEQGGASKALVTTITDPTSLQTTYTQSTDKLAETVLTPEGITADIRQSVDPVTGSRYTRQVSYTATGKSLTMTHSRAYAFDDGDPVQATYTNKVQPGTGNERVATVVDDLVNGTIVSTSPVGRTTTTVYDPDTLLVVSVTPPGLAQTTYQYDGHGRLVHEQTGTRETTYTYDSEGNLNAVSNPIAGEITYSYDSDGRFTACTEPNTATLRAQVGYDTSGNAETVTTPLNTVHTFAYDAISNKTSYTSPLNHTYSYTLDGDRRLTGITFPSDAEWTWSYSQGRLTSETTPEGTTSFAYNTAGQIQSIARNAESITYGYTSGLLTSVQQAGVLNATVSCGYDGEFRLNSITYAGATASVAYDADGLVVGTGGYTISRDADTGFVTSVSDGTGISEPTFSTYGEIEQKTTSIGSAPVADWSAAYDGLGRITSNTETLWVTPNTPTVTTAVYTYDNVGRLATVRRDGVLTEEYQYDANGRRILETNASRGITNRAFTYDDDDRLLTAGNATYTFNEDGFLTAKTVGGDTTTYDFALNGELQSVTLPNNGLLIQYLYDAAGQRVARKVDGVIDEKYLWAGPTQLLAVYDGNNALKLRFQYADGRMPVAMVTGGGTKYYLAYNQVGTMRAVFDTSGNVVRQIDYDSFGNILTDSNSALKVPFGFAGGLHDRDTNLVLFGARDYDPDAGRWLAKDPIGFSAGDTNLYAYCLGDPINLLDPLGLNVIDSGLFVAAHISAGMGDYLSMGLTQSFRDWQMGGDIIDTSSGWYTTGKIAGIGVDVGMGLEGALRSGPVTALRRGGLTPNEVGRAGEIASGVAKNTTRIVVSGSKASYRVPDGLTETVISEVKNVAKLSYTEQLRDYAQYARDTGRQFDLFVRQTTELSGPLQRAIDSGDIMLRHLPW